MVLKRSQIAPCIRIETAIQQLRDNLSFDFQGTGRDIHHMVESDIEISLIPGQVCNTRNVDGNNSHGARTLTGAKESACFSAQLPQIESQTAAHTAHVTRFHIAVDIVGKIRCTVLGRHFK